MDTSRSWIIALSALIVITVGFGAPLVSVVALTQIAFEIGGGARAVPATAYALSFAGTGLGGVLFARYADAQGLRAPLLLGASMMAIGCIIAGFANVWLFYLGHLLLGLFGIGAVYSPLVTYVSRWFIKRRGLALSLVASGPQAAGAIWPPIFEIMIGRLGWSGTLFWYALLSALIVFPLIVLLCKSPPLAHEQEDQDAPRMFNSTIPKNVIFVVLCIAIISCCIPMAMPMGHLVAFCIDRGFASSHGTNMLALLLLSGFVSRLLWGYLSDAIGGLKTVLLSGLCQAIGLVLFLLSYDLAALYIVSILFGLGFGGIIPAYVLAVREIFPSREAGWRIATLLFASLMGMAAGAWLSGYTFDLTLSYDFGWGLGVVFNAIMLLQIGGLLISRQKIPKQI